MATRSLCGEISALAGRCGIAGLELEKIEFEKAGTLYRVFARLSGLSRPAGLIKLDAGVRALVNARVEWRVSCDCGPACAGDIADIRSAVLDIAQAAGASCLNILKNADISASGDEIRIGFKQSILVNIFESRNLADKISGFFSMFYGLSVVVSAYFDENAAKAIEAVLPEVESAAEAKPEGVPSRPPQKAEPRPPKPPAKIAAENQEVVRGKKVTAAPMNIEDILGPLKNIAIAGELISLEVKEVKNGKLIIVTFGIYDGTGSIYCSMFLKREEYDKLKDGLVTGERYLIRGNVNHDNYLRELCVSPIDINRDEGPPPRMDNAEEKRVELHLHTTMSAMDATNKVNKCIERAIKWGHDAIAITDHGVVQAFPDAERAAKGRIKVIYGMEAYLIDDTKRVHTGKAPLDKQGEYVAFDIETTGLDPKTQMITEIGAVKINNGRVGESFSTFVNPNRPIPMEITRLTGITDEMVAGAPAIDEALPKFKEFCGGATLVAHNASFDTSFIYRQSERLGLGFDNEVVDTLELSRRVFTGLKSYKLDSLARHLKLPLNHHRAFNDAECCAKIFLSCLERAGGDVNSLEKDLNTSDLRPYHAIILVKNKTGLKNLYKLVSLSHLKYFYKRPRIPKTQLMSHREGLILGTACEQGELFRALLRKEPEDRIRGICEFYDYFEVQPKSNNAFLIRQGELADESALEEIYFKILKLGRRYGKRVAATTDTHFLDAKDEYYRRIIFHSQKYPDADMQAPLYYRTTREMLDEFSFLGEDAAYEVVVKNTRAIAGEIESFKLLPEGTAMPKIEGASEELESMCYEKARSIYGQALPEIVESRLKRELSSILGHGFGILYYIAQKLVKKSLSDGYLVGSRGSVGSSFAAFSAGITEVNPLPPHYVCPSCKYSDFDVDVQKYECGIDLPDAVCPVCGNKLTQTGYNIPFEVFLGINADKVPDIDLNFSSEYQPKAHAYTEEIFGERFVFRAGTISSLQDKTAFGHVKKYLEDKGEIPSRVEMARLVSGVAGVKKTTGQHPGGLVVVPKDMDIHDFSPVQHPANDTGSKSITTHFDFNSMHDTLVKLDILGHDDPTVLRMLQRLTGIDPKTVPLNDKPTMSLFCSPEALGVASSDILGCKNGAIALPEFGTKFVRQMLDDTRPSTMAELIRISGLSHGTNVWVGNAQDLVRNGTATLSTVICTRDDIMLYLVSKGVEQKLAFFTMENVRKGKGLKPDMEQAMVEHGVPGWFIESCKKISYMFPKAHAAAYVMMAVRIAYFKVHYPLEFYAAYFSVRAENFSAEYVMDGEEGVRRGLKKLEALGKEATVQQQDMAVYLEVAVEMYARGFRFLNIDINKSHATEFLIEGDGLRLPFITIPGTGKAAAQALYEARQAAEFTSIEDMRKRGKLNSSAIEKLRGFGCLTGFEETDQLSLKIV